MEKKTTRSKIANLFNAMNLSLFFLIFIGCQDKDYYDPNFKRPGEVGNDPSQLDFSTTQKVILDLNYDVPEGTLSAFQAYAENPFVKNSSGGWDMRCDLTPVTSGIFMAGSSEIVRTLPAFIDELYVYSPHLFVPSLLYGKIDNGRVTFQEFGLNMPINEDDTSTRSLGTGAFDHYLTGYNMTSVYEGAGKTYYRPEGKYITKKNFPTTVTNAITTTFPEGKKADPKYYKDATISIHKDDGSGNGAELWVSVISARAQYNNSLAYFCYDGPKEDLDGMTEAERSEFYIICPFQFAKSSPTMYGALRPGEYVKLKYYDKNTRQLKDKFPVGTTVGWVLSADGFVVKGSQGYTRNRSIIYPWYYSVSAWNPENNNKNHTILFSAKNGDDCYVCFGFEDDNNDSPKGDGDCNDVMFHVLASPGDAIMPPPEIPEEGTIETTDTKYGYLAFEDNWPKKGDYDLNDVVVKYKSTITYLQKVEKELTINRVAKAPNEPYVKKVEDRISLVHAGADYENSFAYKVDFPFERLKSVMVNGSPANIVEDGEGFLVELCANVNQVIVPYEYGTTPKDYEIIMEFIEEEGNHITQDEFNANELHAPYNPYISPRDEVEVHLPMYKPTTRAKDSYFGTEDDRSGEGLWYVSGDKNNYPFAIHLSGIDDFLIPVEKESIDKTYPNYNNWVDSNKTQDQDWYLHPAKR